MSASGSGVVDVVFDDDDDDDDDVVVVSERERAHTRVHACIIHTREGHVTVNLTSCKRSEARVLAHRDMTDKIAIP